MKVDLRRPSVVGRLRLGGGRSMPQDVKLSPDGRLFSVADMMAGGLWEVDARRLSVVGFLHTGRGAHGLPPSRDARRLYVSNRGEGTVSVVSFASGRYDGEVYAIDTRTGHLRARIRVGNGPHGLSVWPQPGRHSLGHTGIMR